MCLGKVEKSKCGLECGSRGSCCRPIVVDSILSFEQQAWELSSSGGGGGGSAETERGGEVNADTFGVRFLVRFFD